MQKKLILFIITCFIMCNGKAQKNEHEKDTLRFNVRSFDGLILPAQITGPRGILPNKIIVFINGSTPYDETGNIAPIYTENGKNVLQKHDFYTRFLDFMPAKSYSVVSMAKRSFVRPAGIPRPSLDDLALDIIYLIDALKDQNILTPEKQLILAGYSEGSITAAKVLGMIEVQPDACILLGSASNAFDYQNKSWEEWHKTDVLRRINKLSDEQIQAEFKKWKSLVQALQQANEEIFENEFKKNKLHGIGFAQWESYYIDNEVNHYYPEADILKANIPVLMCIGSNDMSMPEKRAFITYQNLLDNGFEKVTYKIIGDEVHQYKRFDVFGIMDAWLKSGYISTQFEITAADQHLMNKYAELQYWTNEVNKIPYEDSPAETLQFFNRIKSIWINEPENWFSLGIRLFGNGWHDEAFTAFSKAAQKGSLIESASLVWLGHLSDLKNLRNEAVSYYNKALDCYPGFPVQHDNWNIHLTYNWIEERLEKPFQWK
jgi:pimeloyl-ACP methyl ester carboxylesterase